MTNRQFIFSLTVGIVLALLGGLILNKASVGLGLIALGIAIATLALFTRNTQEESRGLQLSPAAEH